uniref:Uncharacterized protein n=1 Tax=viral metagenome TaxID=1070528 RepID=A0A6C0F082_9ZZZZ
MSSNSFSSFTSIFQKKTERNVIIDPFSCLIKLSLLRFLDSGTKISIYQNRIHFNTPSYVQGIVRFMYGDNREHLHNLYLPIQKCVEWFWNDKNMDMTFMFTNAVIGLKMLKYAYNEYATIQHTIDYYIIILMQKNAHLTAKIGISALDIDKITNGMINAESKILPLPLPLPIDKQPKKEEHVDTTNHNNTNHANHTSTKNKNKQTKDIDTKLINEIEHVPEPEKYLSQDIPTKDIHKFLYELWNLREIDIVINLYKEMETKQPGDERDNIYSNIMSYCSMKENKLHNYIEANSSIL